MKSLTWLVKPLCLRYGLSNDARLLDYGVTPNIPILSKAGKRFGWHCLAGTFDQRLMGHWERAWSAEGKGGSDTSQGEYVSV